MKINCVKCGKVKECRHKFYRKRVEDYGSVEALKSKYTCRECRYPTNPIQQKIKKIKRQLNDLIEKYSTVDMNIQTNQNSFLSDVVNIMALYNITDYKFNIVDNKIKAVTLSNLPLLGTVIVKLRS